jgi:hypothetical protein
VQSSPASRHFLPHWSKYSPHHSVHKHPQSMSSLSVRPQVSHPYKITGRIIVLHILISKFLKRRREDKRPNTATTIASTALIGNTTKLLLHCR